MMVGRVDIWLKIQALSVQSDNIMYKSGNYFKPGKAQAFADFIKENISKFHDNGKKNKKC